MRVDLRVGAQVDHRPQPHLTAQQRQVGGGKGGDERPSKEPTATGDGPAGQRDPT
jgi:hypothetical protein